MNKITMAEFRRKLSKGVEIYNLRGIVNHVVDGDDVNLAQPVIDAIKEYVNNNKDTCKKRKVVKNSTYEMQIMDDAGAISYLTYNTGAAAYDCGDGVYMTVEKGAEDNYNNKKWPDIMMIYHVVRD